MITLIGGEKGGTGKSTIATNLAANLIRSGAKLLLVDCDPQGTARAWTARRTQDPELLGIQCVALRHGEGTDNVARALVDFAAQVDHLIIDCGGQDSRELRAAMAVADVLVTPFRPAQADLWTLRNLATLVNAAQGLNPRLSAFVVINQASSNWKVNKADAAQELVHRFAELKLAAVIRMREAFDDAMAEGRGVGEWTNPKAQHEIETLIERIYGGKKQAKKIRRRANAA